LNEESAIHKLQPSPFRRVTGYNGSDPAPCLKSRVLGNLPVLPCPEI
jgi:hypothetical protein